MKNHYWTSPIAIYLFLGGLGGGIAFLAWVFSSFVMPDADMGNVFAGPLFASILALALGCFFLVFELGQPPVFWRVFATATAIIKWGATLLSFCMIFEFVWLVSYLPWEWISGLAAALVPLRGACLAVAGIAGFGIMVYTGVMLSTLKAHAFWATPALPVLFTTSAISTACAACALFMNMWPGAPTAASLAASVEAYEILHLVDIILVIAELCILLIMILSFLGAGTRTAKRVALRWVKGSYAPFFWIGMVGLGLFVPLCLYLGGGAGAHYAAPVLVLCGGLLLRYLCVWSDDRQPLPGEKEFYQRLPKKDAQFLTAWNDGDMY